MTRALSKRSMGRLLNAMLAQNPAALFVGSTPMPEGTLRGAEPKAQLLDGRA